MSGLVDDLDIDESEYQLPSGKVLRIVGLDIFQRVEIQRALKEIKDGDEIAKSKVFKEVVRLAVVDDDLEPCLKKGELNKLSRVNDGEILFNIFNEAMALSGANVESAETAKKK